MKIALLFLFICASAFGQHAISEYENEPSPVSNRLFVFEIPGTNGVFRTIGKTNHNISYGQLRAAVLTGQTTDTNVVKIVITNSIQDILGGNGYDPLSYRETLADWHQSSSSTLGDNLSAVGTASSVIGAISTEPFGPDMTVVGSPLVAYVSGNTGHYMAHLRRAIYSCTASTNNTIRFWAGLQSAQGTGFTTTLGNDLPAATKVLAFRYSSGVDSGLKFVSQDGTGAQTVTDLTTSFAADTAATMEIRFGLSSVFVFVNGVLKATVSATLPASTVIMYSSMGMQATAGTPTFRPIYFRTLERYGF